MSSMSTLSLLISTAISQEDPVADASAANATESATPTVHNRSTTGVLEPLPTATLGMDDVMLTGDNHTEAIKVSASTLRATNDNSLSSQITTLTRDYLAESTITRLNCNAACLAIAT